MEHVIVFDLETGGVDRNRSGVIQIAALAIDRRRCEVVPGSEFNSMAKPEDDEIIEDGALAVNKKSRAEIAAAPSIKDVYWEFVNYCKRFNTKGFKGKPVPCGQNILGFDMLFIQRMSERYGNLDKNGVQNIFNQTHRLELLDINYLWQFGVFEKYNMDYQRTYFGMSQDSKNNAHDALQDVKDTAAIVLKYLQLHQLLQKKVNFENCFKPKELAAST